MLSPRHMDLHLGILGSRRQRLIDEQHQLLMKIHGHKQAIQTKQENEAADIDIETEELKIEELKQKADALEEKIQAQSEVITAYEDEVLKLTSDPSKTC